MIEALEARELLSGTTTTSTTIQGYTPAEISQAYGFDSVSLDNGAVAANGAGQTIAIVDAYNDPDIFSDLATFDSKFGLPAPPNFAVVNQGGTSATSIAISPMWSGEISRDVEWIHASAPGANILLVEASSASLSDLTAAVTYASHVPGVSVVSLSWGTEAANQQSVPGTGPSAAPKASSNRPMIRKSNISRNNNLYTAVRSSGATRCGSSLCFDISHVSEM